MPANGNTTRTMYPCYLQGFDGYDQDYDGTIQREYMPQIDGKDYPKLLKAWRADFGADSAEHETVDYRRLKLRQHAVLTHALPEEQLAIPVLVSSDNVVIDGNHRTAAHLAQHCYQGQVIRLKEPFRACVDWLTTQPYVYHRDFEEGEREALGKKALSTS